MQCVHERVLCPILAGCALFLDPALENSKRLRRVTAGNVVVYSKGHCTEMRFTESEHFSLVLYQSEQQRTQEATSQQTARLTHYGIMTGSHVLLEESRHADIHRLSGSSRLAVQSMAILTVYQLLKTSAKLERGLFLFLLRLYCLRLACPAIL